MNSMVMALTATLTATLAPSVFISIGDTWDREKVKTRRLQQYSPVVQKAIHGTGMIAIEDGETISKGTAFYIGRHFNKHLFISNAHVVSRYCSKFKVKMLSREGKVGSFRCEKVLLKLYHSRSSDLALFSVKADADEEALLGNELDIDWDFSPVAGQNLVTAGHGVAKSNPRRNPSVIEKFEMRVVDHSECMVISPTGKLHFFASKVQYAFATGCDASSGDSGSAVLDRETQKVVGLLFSIGKNRTRLSSSELSQMVGDFDHPRMWKSLTYAISLAELKSQLSPYLQR